MNTRLIATILLAWMAILSQCQYVQGAKEGDLCHSDKGHFSIVVPPDWELMNAALLDVITQDFKLADHIHVGFKLSSGGTPLIPDVFICIYEGAKITETGFEHVIEGNLKRDLLNCADGLGEGKSNKEAFYFDPTKQAIFSKRKLANSGTDNMTPSGILGVQFYGKHDMIFCAFLVTPQTGKADLDAFSQAINSFKFDEGYERSNVPIPKQEKVVESLWSRLFKTAIYVIALMITLKWMYGNRLYIREGRDLTTRTAAITGLFLVSIITVFVTDISSFHLLWIFPVCWIVGSAFPFGPLALLGKLVLALSCTGLSKDKADRNREKLATAKQIIEESKSQDDAVEKLKAADMGLTRWQREELLQFFTQSQNLRTMTQAFQEPDDTNLDTGDQVLVETEANENELVDPKIQMEVENDSPAIHSELENAEIEEHASQNDGETVDTDEKAPPLGSIYPRPGICPTCGVRFFSSTGCDTCVNQTYLAHFQWYARYYKTFVNDLSKVVRTKRRKNKIVHRYFDVFVALVVSGCRSGVWESESGIWLADCVRDLLEKRLVAQLNRKGKEPVFIARRLHGLHYHFDMMIAELADENSSEGFRRKLRDILYRLQGECRDRTGPEEDFSKIERELGRVGRHMFLEAFRLGRSAKAG